MSFWSAWYPWLQWTGIWWWFAYLHCQSKSLPKLQLPLYFSACVYYKQINFSCPKQLSAPISAFLILPKQLIICLHLNELFYPGAQVRRHHPSLFLFSHHSAPQPNTVISQVELIVSLNSFKAIPFHTLTVTAPVQNSVISHISCLKIA